MGIIIIIEPGTRGNPVPDEEKWVDEMTSRERFREDGALDAEGLAPPKSAPLASARTFSCSFRACLFHWFRAFLATARDLRLLKMDFKMMELEHPLKFNGIIVYADFEIIRESSLLKPQRRVNIEHAVEWFRRRWKISNFVAGPLSACLR